jgi:hypothetical protein
MPCLGLNKSGAQQDEHPARPLLFKGSLLGDRCFNLFFSERSENNQALATLRP